MIRSGDEKLQTGRTEGGRSSQSSQRSSIYKVTEKTDMNHGKVRGDASVEHAALTEGAGYIYHRLAIPYHERRLTTYSIET